MKAILLAGGQGTRARPFTDYIPKSMIPIEGKPVIDHVVRYLARSSVVDEILIVCEFDVLGKQIINYFEGKDNLIPKKFLFIEDRRNGTAGALLRTEESLGDSDEPFLVWFADNLCALDVEDLIRHYYTLTAQAANSKKIITGIIVTRKHRYEETGRVTIDSNNNDRVRAFIEKPIASLESPEALGIYLFSNRIFQYLHQKELNIRDEKKKSFNLSHDILAHIPSAGGNLFSYSLDTEIEWIDIESPVYADRNKEIIHRIIEKMRKAHR
jgi:mannose-1-phosphate guanylyltransferase